MWKIKDVPRWKQYISKKYLRRDRLFSVHPIPQGVSFGPQSKALRDSLVFFLWQALASTVSSLRYKIVEALLSQALWPHQELIHDPKGKVSQIEDSLFRLPLSPRFWPPASSLFYIIFLCFSAVHSGNFFLNYAACYYWWPFLNSNS